MTEFFNPVSKSYPQYFFSFPNFYLKNSLKQKKINLSGQARKFLQGKTQYVTKSILRENPHACRA